MRWVAISGSWRHVNDAVERDVRQDVVDILGRGDGIVTGGALGVDFLATETAFKEDPTATRIKIVLPVPFESFAAHFRRRVLEGVTTSDRVEPNLALLTEIRKYSPVSIEEMDQSVCNEETYYKRNTRVLDLSNELYAYQVNGSGGTQDTIDKACARGMDVRIKAYTIDI